MSRSLSKLVDSCLYKLTSTHPLSFHVSYQMSYTMLYHIFEIREKFIQLDEIRCLVSSSSFIVYKNAFQ